MNNKLKIAVLGLAMALVTAVPSVEAASILIYDGVHAPIVVADNDAFDTNAAPGIVAISGGWADTFLFVAEVGITKPALGSAEAPAMFSNVSATSNTGDQMLQVLFSDTDFGPTNGMGTMLGLVDTTPNGSATYQVWQDAGNTLFNNGGVLGTGTVAGPGIDLPILDSFLVSGAFPYALTQYFEIHHTGNLFVSTNIEASFQVPASVPDGGLTLSLLGLGLVGIERLRRRVK
jgi:hypothetical protein